MKPWKKNLWICWFGSFVTMTGLSQITPVLPLYIEQLGITNVSAVEQWSGIAFGITFVASAIFSPIWGRMADQYGRRPMLLRASLGMAIVISLMGLVNNVYQLVALRLFMGFISGYVSAAITLVATQTPREYSGLALGTLSTGAAAGSLLGPLFGGYLTEIMGIRAVFFAIGALLLFTFVATYLLVQEAFTCSLQKPLSFQEIWQSIADRKSIMAMFMTTFVLQLALMSIEPIITVYIKQLSSHMHYIAFISGVAFSAPGISSILASPRLGKLADRIGPRKVILWSLIAAGVLFIPQAFVGSPWELVMLRFLLGIATAGLLPAVNSLLNKNVPATVTGRIFGYNQSAQFLGTFGGAILGGQMAAFFGIAYVFFATSILLLFNALWVYTQVKPNGTVAKDMF
ncbi:MAG TPA: MFS transporter [Firmicutes bacterium]|nr:MFS transporter [Bacillota bacterium]